MIKKYLSVLTVALVLFSFGIAGAAQIDGLNNAAGPVLPIVDDGAAALSDLTAFVNPGGLGDALIYGYYNVRDNKVDYFQVVNTDIVNGVVVKIRFREAATIADACGVDVDCGSSEVLDFVICLSAGDVWTGAVTGFGAGPAILWSLDSDTMTAPAIPATGQALATQITPTISIAADQTKEGYFEILSYGIWNTTTCAVDADNTVAGDPLDALMGTNYIIDEDNGQVFSYKATALASWNNAEVTPQTTGAEEFNLTSGLTPDAIAWGTSLFQVNYILTKADVYGTYVIDPTLNAETEMVVTFPTRMLNQIEPTTLFDDPTVAYSIWDTEENTITPTAGFSPSFTPTNQLPHEVNVLNIYNAANSLTTTLFTSDVQGNLNAGTFNMGWLGVDLTIGSVCAIGAAPAATVSCSIYGGLLAGGAGAGTPARSFGLPAVAYVFQDIMGSQASFGVSYDTEIIQP